MIPALTWDLACPMTARVVFLLGNNARGWFLGRGGVIADAGAIHASAALQETNFRELHY